MSDEQIEFRTFVDPGLKRRARAAHVIDFCSQLQEWLEIVHHRVPGAFFQMVLFGTILCIFHFDATGLGFFVKQDEQIENGGITTVTGTELDTLAGKGLLPILLAFIGAQAFPLAI